MIFRKGEIVVKKGNSQTFEVIGIVKEDIYLKDNDGAIKVDKDGDPYLVANKGEYKIYLRGQDNITSYTYAPDAWLKKI